jgi:hypothetical protein
MAVGLAYTLGVKYHQEPHPKLGEINPDGYVVIFTDTMDEQRAAAVKVFGDQGGGVNFAFDYLLEPFESPEPIKDDPWSNAGPQFHPLGRLLEITFEGPVDNLNETTRIDHR